MKLDYKKSSPLLNKQYYKCHTTVIVFDVPRRTLYDHVKENKKARNPAHERYQNLTHVEEKELIRWITRRTITGYPPRYNTLREMTEKIRKRCVKHINKDGMQLIEYNDIDQH